jgi:hypothetical protein
MTSKQFIEEMQAWAAPINPELLKNDEVSPSEIDKIASGIATIALNPNGTPELLPSHFLSPI